MKNTVWLELLLVAVLFSVISLKDQLPNKFVENFIESLTVSQMVAPLFKKSETENSKKKNQNKKTVRRKLKVKNPTRKRLRRQKRRK
jgi:hypothetical protein